MMEFEKLLKIQAFLDGELPEAEAREVAAWVAADAEATAL
jgi:anti-sigma factor RsiW